MVLKLKPLPVTKLPPPNPKDSMYTPPIKKIGAKKGK